MPVEGREQVTRIRINRVNGQPEELEGLDGRRQPSVGGTSRVSREAQARICERPGCNSRAYSARSVMVVPTATGSWLNRHALVNFSSDATITGTQFPIAYLASEHN